MTNQMFIEVSKAGGMIRPWPIEAWTLKQITIIGIGFIGYRKNTLNRAVSLRLPAPVLHCYINKTGPRQCLGFDIAAHPRFLALACLALSVCRLFLFQWCKLFVAPCWCSEALDITKQNSITCGQWDHVLDNSNDIVLRITVINIMSVQQK